jgi:scyllo-inositol 2-dehydrogenase (NADP+)
MADRYRIVGVTDIDPRRRKEATERFGCKPYETFESLIADDSVEVIVVATPSHLHVQHSIKALGHGRHVICEKPVANSSTDMAMVMKAARINDRILAPFQNARYDSMFQKICEIVRSGRLGRIVEIRATVQMFGRRWDWQTLREFGGGQLNNIGSHVIDQLLVLCGDFVPRVFCRMDRAVASGDAEDHVKVILYGKSAPLIDLEISSACAYPQERWLVMGGSGGLKSADQLLCWKYIDFSRIPPRPVDHKPEPNRQYNSESLEWTEETWTVPEGENIQQTHWMFYSDIYHTVRENAPLYITPASVARQIRVIEECHKMAWSAPESD